MRTIAFQAIGSVIQFLIGVLILLGIGDVKLIAVYWIAFGSVSLFSLLAVGVLTMAKEK